MTSEEFRRLVEDQIDSACREPFGRDAAVAEIVSTYEHDVVAAWKNGQAGREHVVEGR